MLLRHVARPLLRQILQFLAGSVWVDAKTLNHSAPTQHEDDHTDGHPGGISVLVSCGVGNGARGVSAARIACFGLEGVTDSQQHSTNDDAEQGHIHPHPSDHAHQAHKLQGGQDIIIK